MKVVWFLVGIPLAVEVLSGLLGCRDLYRHAGLRASAIERLVLPTLLLGATLWLAPPQHWNALAAAFALVLLAQLAFHYVARRALARPDYGARRFDTEGED
jgi:ABC-type Mn2+/Zn2+ transport system permease subunit